MSKAIKTAFNIDKLKLCYRTTADIFDHLTKKYNLNTDDKSNINCLIDNGEYKLSLIDHSCNEIEVTAITISVCVEDNTLHKLGVFDFKRDGRYCFFNFENKALYTDFANSKNCLDLIKFISKDIGLEYNNITTLEIAKDSTRNYVTAVQKFIRDYNDYEMFINGHIVKDENRTIPHYRKMYSSSRKKMSRVPTLYFDQSDGPALKIYDKRREMEEEERAKLAYLPQWLSFGENAPIYRAEVTFKNRDIREYMAKIGIIGENAMDFIANSEQLAQMWQYGADRLIYFRDKATGTIIRLADI